MPLPASCKPVSEIKAGWSGLDRRRNGAEPQRSIKHPEADGSSTVDKNVLSS